MRIAVVTSYFPNSVQPYRGHSAFHTLRNMAGSATIRVFCPLVRYPGWLPPRHFPYGRAELTHNIPDLATEYFEYPAIPLATRAFNAFTCAHFLKDRLQAFHPDVILNYFIHPEGCAAVSVGKRLKKPVVLGVIGSDVNRIPDPLTSWHTRRALREANAVITVSNQLTNRAIQLGAHKNGTWTISNGCDTDLFRVRDAEAARDQLGISQKGKLVLFVGWLSPTKGVEELLKAFEVLARDKPFLSIAFVGEGALAPAIRAMAISGALAGRVLTPGIQPSSTVALWMAAADVFCLPSYAEGCPNVVLEALACGRPVVASDVGAIPELVNTDSGFLVPPKDAQALAAALDRALSTNWDATEISARSNRSWRTVAEETRAVCDKVVN